MGAREVSTLQSHHLFLQKSTWNQDVCSIIQACMCPTVSLCAHLSCLEPPSPTSANINLTPFLRPHSDSTFSKISILVVKVFSLDTCHVTSLLLGCMILFSLSLLFSLALHFQLYCNSWMSDTICLLSLDCLIISSVIVLIVLPHPLSCLLC